MERTKYMQELIMSCYKNVAIEAVMHGFDGSLERVIASRIRIDYLTNHAEACELFEAMEREYPKMSGKEIGLKVAYLITSSKIPENVKP